MNFFGEIRTWFIWATQVFVDLALDCFNSPLLPDFLGDAFVYLSDFTSAVAGKFWVASHWWDKVEDAISDILSWSNIRSLIRSWLDGIEDALEWFESWFSNVLDAIDVWWDTTLQDVKNLIAIATERLEDLIEAWDSFWETTWPELTGKLDSLKSAWDSFWTVTLPGLISQIDLDAWWDNKLLELNELIGNILKIWLPFRDDLVGLWEDIKEFFTAPLDWLEAKFTDWFLGEE